MILLLSTELAGLVVKVKQSFWSENISALMAYASAHNPTSGAPAPSAWHSQSEIWLKM